MNGSPLAIMFDRIVAQDEADRVTAFAQLRAAADHAQYKRDAFAHARSCLDTRNGWDEESLSTNIESNFPDLTLDECDEIACQALFARA